jgi:group I intron endonuclease
MLIYKITNKVNGKIYIGKTTETLKSRWSKHLYMANNGQKYKRCTAIGSAIKKYGPKNFAIEQIDSAKTEEELLTKESFHAENLNSYYPNGYNIAKCGFGGRKMKTDKKCQKTWIFLSPQNKIIKTDYLKKFCRENNLTYSSMCQLYRNKITSYKGWRNARRENKFYVVKNIKIGKTVEIIDLFEDIIDKSIALDINPYLLDSLLSKSPNEVEHGIEIKTFYTEIPSELLKIKLERLPNRKTKKEKKPLIKRADYLELHTNKEFLSLLDNETLTLFKFKNTLKFSKLKNLNHSIIRGLLNISKDFYNYYKYWTKPDTPMRRSILISPSGEEFTVIDGDVFKFCANQKIGTFESILDLIKEKRSYYKGWTLKKTWFPTKDEFNIVGLSI